MIAPNGTKREILILILGKNIKKLQKKIVNNNEVPRVSLLRSPIFIGFSHGSYSNFNLIDYTLVQQAHIP